MENQEEILEDPTKEQAQVAPLLRLGPQASSQVMNMTLGQLYIALGLPPPLEDDEEPLIAFGGP